MSVIIIFESVDVTFWYKRGNSGTLENCLEMLPVILCSEQTKK